VVFHQQNLTKQVILGCGIRPQSDEKALQSFARYSSFIKTLGIDKKQYLNDISGKTSQCIKSRYLQEIDELENFSRR
jgi:hypothetical protein